MLPLHLRTPQLHVGNRSFRQGNLLSKVRVSKQCLGRSRINPVLGNSRSSLQALFMDLIASLSYLAENLCGSS